MHINGRIQYEEEFIWRRGPAWRAANNFYCPEMHWCNSLVLVGSAYTHMDRPGFDGISYFPDAYMSLTVQNERGCFKTMKDITNYIQTYYRYNGKFYTISNRKNLRLNDIFLDGRDYGVKIIETESDLMNAAYIAPELYIILTEVTVQD